MEDNKMEKKRKKKYPIIKPKYIKDSKGKVLGVYLDYDVYESIFEEIAELRSIINKTKNNQSKDISK
jgi:hypothetical protein